MRKGVPQNVWQLTDKAAPITLPTPAGGLFFFAFSLSLQRDGMSRDVTQATNQLPFQWCIFRTQIWLESILWLTSLGFIKDWNHPRLEFSVSVTLNCLWFYSFFRPSLVPDWESLQPQAYTLCQLQWWRGCILPRGGVARMKYWPSSLTSHSCNRSPHLSPLTYLPQ